MNKTGFIFDFDGTLIDSTRDITRAVNDVFEEKNLPPVTDDEVEEGIGHGAKELVEHLLEVPPENGELDTMVERFRYYYQKRCTENIRPYDGIPDLLQSLEDSPRAIVTNKPYDMTATILDKLEWTSWFEPIYGADSLATMKPSPEPLHEVQKSWDGAVSQFVMIGDNWTDIEAGRKAGMITVGCEYGLGDTEALRAQEPNYRVQSPSEILPTLQNLS